MAEDVVVFVEVPSGSRNKYELDEELGAIVLDRRLFTSMAYPADYGFIEGTLGEDGDPLDALVLVGEPTFPGCRIRARVVGVFHMADEKGPDEKIICVPLKDPAWMRVSDVHDIPAELRNEVEHFFQVYKDLEEAKVETHGYGNRAEAERVVAEARARAPTVMVVFGAIAPHGDPAFVEGSATRRGHGGAWRAGSSARRPTVTVVLTPHNVHVEGAFAVVVSATSPARSTSRATSSSLPGRRELRGRSARGATRRRAPRVGVSYGSNDPPSPSCRSTGGRRSRSGSSAAGASEPRPVVVVSPARELPLGRPRARRAGARRGAATAGAAALVASADHGHAHDPDGPFGFHPAAADYDARVVELVRENRLGDAVALEPIVEEAKADSLWQLAMLHGALGDGVRSELSRTSARRTSGCSARRSAQRRSVDPG